MNNRDFSQNLTGIIKLSKKQSMFINDVLRGNIPLEYDTRWLLKSILEDGYYSECHRSILNNVRNSVRSGIASNYSIKDNIYNQLLP